MTNYFNPPVAMSHIKSGNAGALCIVDGRLAVWNKTHGTRVIAPNWVVVKRQSVTGWLMGILYDLYKDPGNADALQRAEDVLRSAGLIDNDGRPRKTMTLVAGAGGMEE